MILEKLRNDDSAVSPVIGVILMVAITVILAAVIASFVLGLGDQTDDVSPNIQFDAEWDTNNNQTTIKINTGDADADPNNVYLRGSAIDGSVTWGDEADIGAGESVTLTVEEDTSADDRFVAGSPTVGNWAEVEGEEITIVFETDSTSDTLDTFEVPDY